MKFPKTLKHPWSRTVPSVPTDGRKHLNAKFYTSAVWRKVRKHYINRLIEKQQSEADDPYLIDLIPVCEMCYDQYRKGIRPGANKGKELDHIIPMNPNDAMNHNNIYGNPFSFSNLQLLCARCHAEKSGKDKKTLTKLNKEHERKSNI